MSDNSTDPGAASSVNPNSYLAPIAGGGAGMIIVYIIAAFLLYRYIFKKY